MSDYLEKIQKAIFEHQKDAIQGLVKDAIKAGVEADVILNDALIAPMHVVGSKFADGSIFIPEMMFSAMIMKAGLAVLKPYFEGGEVISQGTVIMGTVKGDLHDIGKNIVCMMMEASGFTVVDLGIDVDANAFADRVEEIKPDILGLSALLTTTMPEIQNVMRVLKNRALRDQVKVIIGGAPVNQEFTDRVGADAYGKDAAEAVAISRELIAAR